MAGGQWESLIVSAADGGQRTDYILNSFAVSVLKPGGFAIAANLSIDFRPRGWRGTMVVVNPGRSAERDFVMMGIGTAELLILVIIALLTVVPGVVGVGVLIWLIVRGSKSSSDRHREGSADRCPACGANVSPASTTCPQCGSPTFSDHVQADR